MREKLDWREMLREQDAKTFDGRARRLEFLNSLDCRPEEGSPFYGGLIALELFEETRLAYLNGVCFGIPVLVHSFLEIEIAALLYGAGLNEAASMAMASLIAEAYKRNVIDRDLEQRTSKLRQMRNSLTHFRRPGEVRTLAGRMVRENRHYVDQAIEDADWCVRLMFDFIAKTR